jgi:hypothetical protein
LAHPIYWGIVISHGDPVGNWFKDYISALSLMGGKGVAIGTDANGLSPQIPFDEWPFPTSFPITVASKFAPPSGAPTPALPPYKLGSRTYDFHRDGIANYGLLPDFFQAVSERGSNPGSTGYTALNALYHSAEDVIEMWEKVEAAAPLVCSGTNGQPSITVSPANVDFGKVVVDGEAQRPISIANTGCAPLVISGLVLTDDAGVFSVSPARQPMRILIQPNDTLTVTVGFGPVAKQSYAGSLLIQSDAQPVRVSLRGQGFSEGNKN